MAAVCSAEVGHCAAVHLGHVYGGEQRVAQLLVPVLQALYKLGHLQPVVALLALVDPFVGVTVIR